MKASSWMISLEAMMRMKASWNRLELVLQLVALQFDSSCTSMIRYMLASRMLTPYRDFIAI